MSKGAVTAQPSKVDLDRFNLCESFDSFQEMVVAVTGQINGSSVNKFSKPYVRSMMHITTRLCTEMMLVFGDDGTPAELESLKQKLSGCDIFVGELEKEAVKQIDAYKPDIEPGSLIIAIIQKHVSSDAVLATVLSAVCGYILAELTELGYNDFRDTRKLLDSWLFTSDCKLLKDLISSSEGEGEGEGEGETTAKDKVQDEETGQEDRCNISNIRARYASSSIPFLCISSAAQQDEELKALFKRLGIEFLPCPGPVPAEEEEEGLEEEAQAKQDRYAKTRARNAMLREMRKEKVTKSGLDFGLSIFDEIEAAPITLSEFEYFCTKHPCVDKNCMTGEDEENEVDSDAEQMLGKVRSGDLTLSIEELSQFDALPSLQILGAVLFRLQEAGDATVSLTELGDSDDDDTVSMFYELVDMLGEKAKFDDIPQVTITMYGETFNDCHHGSRIACTLTYSNKIHYALNMPTIKECINNYVSGMHIGMHDEDSLGEFSAIHIAAYRGLVDAIDILVTLGADINQTSFDGGNAIHHAIGGVESVDLACLMVQKLIDIGVKKDKQVYMEPGWQSNMMTTAGFSPLLLAVAMHKTEVVQVLLAAGADAGLLTGPLPFQVLRDDRCEFKTQSLLNVTEYDYAGHRVNALHLALLLEKEKEEQEGKVEGKGKEEKDKEDKEVNGGVALLLQHPSAVALVDSRVGAGKGGESEYDFSHEEKSYRSEFEHSLNAPLHLAKKGSASVKALCQAGASLMCQNFDLELSGSGLAFNSMISVCGHEMLLLIEVCDYKGLPIEMTATVMEFLFSIHLREQLERTFEQETGPSLWPTMAVALLDKQDKQDGDENGTSKVWEVEGTFEEFGDEITQALIHNARYSERRQYPHDPMWHDQLNRTTPISSKLDAFVRRNLRQSKEQKARELMEGFDENQWKQIVEQPKLSKA